MTQASIFDKNIKYDSGVTIQMNLNKFLFNLNVEENLQVEIYIV